MMDTEFNLLVNPPIKPLEFKEEKKNYKSNCLNKKCKSAKSCFPVIRWISVFVADRVNIM